MLSDFILTIGNAGFTIDDVPESLPIGGDQITAVRKFPGGGIHVQSLGAFDREISWDSIFVGPGAWQRAQAVGIYRVRGDVVLLRYQNITRYVIVESFYVDYMNDEYVPYSIKLQPTVKSGVPISLGSPTISTAPKTPTPVSQAAPTNDQTTKPPAQKKYTIKSGDTLWGLAVKYYGDGTKWTKIASANQGINPNALKIGTTIVIP